MTENTFPLYWFHSRRMCTIEKQQRCKKGIESVYSFAVSLFQSIEHPLISVLCTVYFSVNMKLYCITPKGTELHYYSHLTVFKGIINCTRAKRIETYYQIAGDRCLSTSKKENTHSIRNLNFCLNTWNA